MVSRPIRLILIESNKLKHYRQVYLCIKIHIMLYIRHAQKAHRNGASHEFPLDPGLTDTGRKHARDRFRELVILYGIPSQIVCSPFLRARETAQIANEIITEITGKSLDILCEPQIGEYLGHHRDKTMHKCLRPETLIHNPIPPEQWKQYSKRIRNFVRNIRPYNGTIWYITHGIVIKSIAHFLGYNMEYPEELSGIYINPNDVSSV